MKSTTNTNKQPYIRLKDKIKIPLAERMNTNSIEVRSGRPFKYNDPLILASRINEYFIVCEEEHKPVTMSGLALHLELSRSSLINYEHHFPNCKELFHAIKNARLRVEASYEGKLVSGIPATGLIFGLKNNFGWKDQMQLDVTSNGESLFDKESILNASRELLLDEEKGKEDLPLLEQG